MKSFPILSRLPALLALSVASLLSSLALAETAGRINFVSGPVTIVSTDSQPRAAKKGDSIETGDRIETGSGRAQVRFVDGAFLSLQPNTVFSVEQYRYRNPAAGEDSLLLSLLKGGMRTVTGAIGKANRAAYQVRTPVATIGIRGTEYLAELNGQTLQVAVGEGAVELANEAGTLVLNAGQSGQVLPGQKPEPVQKAVVATPAPDYLAVPPVLTGGQTEAQGDMMDPSNAHPQILMDALHGTSSNPPSLSEPL